MDVNTLRDALVEIDQQFHENPNQLVTSVTKGTQLPPKDDKDKVDAKDVEKQKHLHQQYILFKVLDCDAECKSEEYCTWAEKDDALLSKVILAKYKMDGDSPEQANQELLQLLQIKPKDQYEMHALGFAWSLVGDFDKSFTFLNKATEDTKESKGCPTAYATLGLFAQTGLLGPEHKYKSLLYYQMGIDKDDIFCMYLMASALKNGFATCEDPDLVCDLFAKAIDAGSVHAKVEFVDFVFNAGISTKYNVAYQELADLISQGNVNAIGLRGMLELEGKGFEQIKENGLKWILEAAKKGGVNSQVQYLKMIILEGAPVQEIIRVCLEFEKINFDKKIINNFILFCYGTSFMDADFKDKDPKKGWDFHTKAVQLGSSESAITQGVIYMNGLDDGELHVDQNPEIGRQYITLAANMGNPTAIEILKSLD